MKNKETFTTLESTKAKILNEIYEKFIKNDFSIQNTRVSSKDNYFLVFELNHQCGLLSIIQLVESGILDIYSRKKRLFTLTKKGIDIMLSVENLLKNKIISYPPFLTFKTAKRDKKLLRREYYQKHKEYYREKHKIYYQKNKERILKRKQEKYVKKMS